jgi:hypothetical protein
VKNRRHLNVVPQAVTNPSPVVMEAVEARILFSNAPWWQSGDAAVGTLKDPNGNVMGSATLVNGLLTVNGTSAGEEIVLGMAFGDPTQAYVRITRCTNPATCQYLSATFVYDRHQISAIVVSAGDGDDYLDFLSFGKALDVPVTLNGGAGDDGIEGNGRAFDENRPDHVVDTTDIGVVMHGGDGNDTLWPAYGPDIVDGGDGNDLIVVNATFMAGKTFVPSAGNDVLHTWTVDHWVDSSLNPPEPQPAPVLTPVTPVATTAPAATQTVATVAAAPAMTLPPPFPINPLLSSDDAIWGT